MTTHRPGYKLGSTLKFLVPHTLRRRTYLLKELPRLEMGRLVPIYGQMLTGTGKEGKIVCPKTFCKGHGGGGEGRVSEDRIF